MSKRILLVNSDCLGSSSLSALLTQEDCECVYAEDSARAVREAKTQSVDLVPVPYTHLTLPTNYYV